jgi:hypothetical protein
MAEDSQSATVDTSGTPVVGIRSDVYERRLELIWMSKDDIEHFESRIGDITLFQNLALFFLSASVPLGIEKWIDYNAGAAQTDMALIIVCGIGTAIGMLFQVLAIARRLRLKTFRESLFKRERKLDTTFTLINGSSSPVDIRSSGAA